MAAVLNTVVPFDFGAKVVVVLLVVVVFQVVVNLLVVVLLAVVLLVVVVVVVVIAVVLAGAKVVVFLLFCLGLFFKSLMIYTKKNMRRFHNLFKILFSFFLKIRYKRLFPCCCLPFIWLSYEGFIAIWLFVLFLQNIR